MQATENMLLMISTQTENHIREQVRYLIEKRGITKVKLGFILGGEKDEVRQQQFSRAQRFLEGPGSIKISTLMRLVTFFEKPLAYFLPTEALYPDTLNLEEAKDDHQKELSTIAESLRKLGMDEDFIKNQLRQIQAMEAYNTTN